MGQVVVASATRVEVMELRFKGFELVWINPPITTPHFSFFFIGPPSLVVVLAVVSVVLNVHLMPVIAASLTRSLKPGVLC